MLFFLLGIQAYWKPNGEQERKGILTKTRKQIWSMPPPNMFLYLPIPMAGILVLFDYHFSSVNIFFIRPSAWKPYVCFLYIWIGLIIIQHTDWEYLFVWSNWQRDFQLMIPGNPNRNLLLNQLLSIGQWSIGIGNQTKMFTHLSIDNSHLECWIRQS